MTASGPMLVADDRIERYKRIAQAEIKASFPDRKSLTDTQQSELNAIENYSSRNDHLHLGILYSWLPNSGKYNLKLKSCLLKIIQKSIEANVISGPWKEILVGKGLDKAEVKVEQSSTCPSTKASLPSPAGKQPVQAGNPNAFHKIAPPSTEALLELDPRQPHLRLAPNLHNLGHRLLRREGRH